MNNCFHTDNVKKFKNIIKKNPNDLNIYYSTAITNKSYKILTYIVTELNYIEDYIELKNKVPSEHMISIKKYISEDKSIDRAIYFQKYITKLIKRNKFNDYTKLYDDNEMQLNYYHIKHMCKLRRKSFILYTFTHYEKYQHVIFRYCIDYDYLTDYIMKLVSLDSCDLYLDNKSIDSYVDYTLYKFSYSHITHYQTIFYKMLSNNELHLHR